MFVVFYFSKKTNQYTTFDGSKYSKVSQRPKGFYLTKPFDATEEGLKGYHEKLLSDQKVITQLLPNNIYLPYVKFHSHRTAKLNCLEKLIDKKFQKKKGQQYFGMFDKVTKDEHQWISKCKNAGLIYAKKGIYKKVSAYDYNSYYSSILGGCRSQFQIPISCPRLETISKLDKKLQYGIYRVNIQYDGSDEIEKVFSFSKDNHYTHIDVMTAQSLKISRFPSLTIELIQDGESNAMIYDNLIKAKDIFGKWYKTLSTIKETTHKNLLAKQMLNIWGTLCEKNNLVIKRRLSEIQKWSSEKQNEYEMLPLDGMLSDDPMFTCQLKLYPYKLPLARIKPFLIAKGRDRISEFVRRNGFFENVVRIFYDGFISKVPIDYYEKKVGHSMKYDKYNNHDITIKSKTEITFDD